jgi:tRNA (cmo5U34)-methyltransferase
MNEFDIKAAAWDSDPMHIERSEAVARHILEKIPVQPSMTAMEYGAGTGITGFLLKEYFKEITLIDNSTEMVRKINEKINAFNTNNLKALLFDLEYNALTNRKFDLIFTQMALHHVNDVNKIINQFHILLNNGGYLAIADLYPEDGSFHGAGFNGYRGFNPDDLSHELINNHFGNVSHQKCYTIDKKISESLSKEFDIFLLIAQRF